MLEPGRQLGRYKILSLIGEGGMGAVYLAADTVLPRNVALKVLPENIANDKERLIRFEREAHAVSALNHPNILTVHEFARQDGLHYLATEHVNGATLRDNLRNGGLPLLDALAIAEQIALALSAAHAAGVVHRDIKPENIMIRADRIVKVLDFGLVKLTGPGTRTSDAEAATRVKTSPGVVMGTVAYMSPEQAKGKQIDARTDVWSFGVVLYELIRGRAPFDGESANEIIAAILQCEPEPLSLHVEGVPTRVEQLVRKCLSKDPEHRYRSIEDALVDLRDAKQEAELDKKLRRSGGSRPEDETQTLAVGASPTDGTAGPTNEELRTVARASSHDGVFGPVRVRNPALIGLAVLSLLAALGLGYWFVARPFSSPAQIESIAVLPFVNASGDEEVEYLSDGMTESVINNLTKLPNLRVISRNSVFRYKGKDTEPAAVGQELRVRSVLTGRVTQRGDNLIVSAELTDTRDNKQLWGQQYNRKATDAFALQQEISRDISETLRSKLTGEEQQRVTKRETASPEAYQLYLRGRFHWNKREDREYAKAHVYFQQAIEKDPTYALAYVGLAETYLLGGNAALSRWERVGRAKAAAQRALEIDPTLGEAYTTLANTTHHDEWSFAEAENAYRRAIELSPNYPTAHHWYAESLVSLGRFEEGFAEYNRALELDPLSLAISTDLGMGYFYARQYDRAVDHLKKLIELDPKYVRTHFYLADVYEQNGMFEEAIAEIEKGSALQGRDPEGFEKAKAIVQKALKESGANGYWRAVLELNKQEGEKGGTVDSISVAACHARLGEPDEAFRWLERAYEERKTDLVFLKVAPKWDNVRSDPRFQDLVRRVGLP